MENKEEYSDFEYKVAAIEKLLYGYSYSMIDAVLHKVKSDAESNCLFNPPSILLSPLEHDPHSL